MHLISPFQRRCSHRLIWFIWFISFFNEEHLLFSAAMGLKFRRGKQVMSFLPSTHAHVPHLQQIAIPGWRSLLIPIAAGIGPASKLPFSPNCAAAVWACICCSPFWLLPRFTAHAKKEITFSSLNLTLTLTLCLGPLRTACDWLHYLDTTTEQVIRGGRSL
jgi:hypothetical protein